MFSIDSVWSSSAPLASSLAATSPSPSAPSFSFRSSSRGASSSSISELSSRTGFSTSSWVSSVSSSMRVICSSLIACCSDGVITSFCASFRDSFCSNAIQEPVLQSKVFSEIDFPDLRIRGKLQRGAGAQDFAVVDDIGPVGYFQCFPHVMFGDEDADAHRLEVPDDALDVEHRDRVDPGARLVEEDIPRVDDQCAGDP